MSPTQPQPEHVSDTALIVAAVRAMETARPDSLIRDPLAGLLAGDRGMDLARAVPSLDWALLIMAMRCRFVDELLLRALADRAIATVVVLGAGLDARPWRLDLPRGLRWIEVDFPDILNYKAAQLSGHPPKCQVERLEVDLNDAAARQAIVRATGDAPALMITEGLIMYLQPSTVEAVAVELPAAGGIRYWLLDVFSLDAMNRAHRNSQAIENLRPKDHLRGAQILELAGRHGWNELARRTYTRDAWNVAPDRIRSLESMQPITDERNLDSGWDPSGVYLFGR
jgi:methyltransferase (TIGR00027 family)